MGIKPRAANPTKISTPGVDKDQSAHLTFALQVEDGWPPVAAEGIPCVRCGNGYRILVPPLFLKGLSVDDIIDAQIDRMSGQVLSWKVTKKSDNSTVWLLRLKSSAKISSVLTKLDKLGCFIAAADQLGCFAVNVPAQVDMKKVDRCLNLLNEQHVTVAFPSFRHKSQ